MMDYVYLQTFHFLFSFFKSISVNCIYRSTVRQTRLSIIATIYIEDLIQTASFRYRWVELLVFLQKEKIVNLLCDL